MKLRVLTANIAFALPRMDRAATNAISHLLVHGIALFLFLIRPSLLARRLPSTSAVRRQHLHARSNLDATMKMIADSHLDIVALNEAIVQVHKATLPTALKSLGFITVAWGEGAHYSDSTVATVLATRLRGRAVDIAMPQGRHIGGGGGSIGISLDDYNVTVVAVHLAVAAKFPRLHADQLRCLSEFATNQERSGRALILVGDWNASATVLKGNRSFRQIGLYSASKDMATCPTFLSHRASLDHIFASGGSKAVSIRAISFGSDHLALRADVILPTPAIARAA